MAIIEIGTLLNNMEKLIEERLSQLEIELVDIEYRKEDHEQILRIFIDKLSGVDLALCSQATRAIRDIIDDSEIFYDHMEVSSPGLDRVLKKDRDFQRFSGQKIKLKTLKVFDGPRKINGILEGFDDKHINVEVEKEVLKIPREMITVIRLDPDF